MTEKWPRTVCLIDMNSFFASVEQRSNSELKNKPIVVVGDMSRRSVILTSSYEARAFGIKTGMLLHEARRLCPAVIPIEGNHDKYLHASEEIKRILLEFSDLVEMNSVDEAYLDVTHSPHVNVETIGQRIHDRIMDDLGLPCSVGVAPNKLLAKLASELKKPNGITIIAPDGIEETLRNMPVEKLCGIGPKITKSLEQCGIKTCGQLGCADFEMLYTRFGAYGHWLKRMGQGKDDDPVLSLDSPETVKSVGHSTTFEKNTFDVTIVRSYLMYLCEKVGYRLRKAGLKGRVAHVSIRFADFTWHSKQVTTTEHTNVDSVIYKLGESAFKSFLPLKQPVRLVGISISQLVVDNESPFLIEGFEKQRILGKVMDTINKRYGKTTVRHAAVDFALKHGVFEPPIPPRKH